MKKCGLLDLVSTACHVSRNEAALAIICSVERSCASLHGIHAAKRAACAVRGRPRLMSVPYLSRAQSQWGDGYHVAMTRVGLLRYFSVTVHIKAADVRVQCL